MLGIVLALFISIGLPLVALLYAVYTKRYIPFLLGMIAFIVAQLVIRLPLLEYLQIYSATYLMMSVRQPVLFAVVIGLSAGVFEELARFILMRFLMKQRDWWSGFLFGVGHGGIEAVLFVGASALTIVFSATANVYNIDFLIGGIERFFAILLHIGLSTIVLQGLVKRKFIYIVLAIIIHGFVDAMVGILPLFMSRNAALIVTEVSLAIIALSVCSYSLSIKRREVLQ